MTQVGTGKSGSRFLKRNYPITTGLTAGTTKQEGRTINLTAEKESLIIKEEKTGL